MNASSPACVPVLFCASCRKDELVASSCKGRDGCPSCTGATNESGKEAKKVARILLQGLLGLEQPRSPQVN